MAIRVPAPAGAELPKPPSVREVATRSVDGGREKRERGGSGHPPLRTVYRWSFRRGRCPHRPVCHGSAAASSLPCVKAAQRSHWVVRRSVAEVARSAGGIVKNGSFRAPARGTFAPGGKSTQKRRSNLRFENPLRAFTRCLSCLFSPRERCTAEISPKCCIVSAPLFAAAFALKCRAVHPRGLWQDCFFKWRPKAATYLCRFAAKARFDNRPLPEGVSKEGGPQPSLFGRSRMGDFQGGRKIETSFPLEWRFWLLLPLLAKVTRRRQIAELPSFIKERKVSRVGKTKDTSRAG